MYPRTSILLDARLPAQITLLCKVGISSAWLPIARYARHVTAIDVTDAAAVKVAERALEPLVKYRAKAKAGRATSDDARDDGEDASGKHDAPAQNPSVTRGAAANDTADAKRNVA